MYMFIIRSLLIKNLLIIKKIQTQGTNNFMQLVLAFDANMHRINKSRTYERVNFTLLANILWNLMIEYVIKIVFI